MVNTGMTPPTISPKAQRTARLSAAGTRGGKNNKMPRLRFGRGGTPGKVLAPSLPVEAKEPARTLKTLMRLEPADCRWPIGDPRKPGFGFCGKAKVPGKSYCQDHYERAYVRVRR